MPHIAEQEFLAHKLQKLGIAVVVIQLSHLSAKIVQKAFEKLDKMEEKTQNLKNISTTVQ